MFASRDFALRPYEKLKCKLKLNGYFTHINTKLYTCVISVHIALVHISYVGCVPQSEKKSNNRRIDVADLNRNKNPFCFTLYFQWSATCSSSFCIRNDLSVRLCFVSYLSDLLSNKKKITEMKKINGIGIINLLKHSIEKYFLITFHPAFE